MIWICCIKVKKEAYFEEIEVGWRKLLKRIFKFEWKEVQSIGLSQDGCNLCAFVNSEMNISFSQNGGNVFCYTRKLTFSVLCSILLRP